LFCQCEGQGRDGYSEEHGCDDNDIMTVHYVNLLFIYLYTLNF